MQKSQSLEHLLHSKTFKQYNVGKPLSFTERRIIIRLRIGILPVRLETARYSLPIIPEDQRVCFCGSGRIEPEFYLLFECEMYKDLRNSWLKSLNLPDNFKDLDRGDKFKVVLNDSLNVKQSAKYLLAVMDQHCQIISSSK